MCAVSSRGEGGSEDGGFVKWGPLSCVDVCVTDGWKCKGSWLQLIRLLSSRGSLFLSPSSSTSCHPSCIPRRSFNLQDEADILILQEKSQRLEPTMHCSYFTAAMWSTHLAFSWKKLSLPHLKTLKKTFQFGSLNMKAFAWQAAVKLSSPNKPDINILTVSTEANHRISLNVRSPAF